MLSDFQDDTRSQFWRGLALAVALGTAAWCGGLAMGAIVSWRIAQYVREWQIVIEVTP